MKLKFISLKIAILLFVLCLSQTEAQTFKHPGIPFTREDLDLLKQHIDNGDEPWASGFTALAASTSANYGMQGPFEIVGRAANVNLNQWINDMRAIYNLSLLWYFTKNEAYAQKATSILDSWATTHTRWVGDETFLAIGDQAELFIPAADILKSTYPGWTEANTQHVNSYFENVMWPEVDVPHPVRPLNQGAIQLKAAVGIAAFLDDPVKWQQVIEAYRYDAGGGLMNTLENGQAGDAGRDDGHWRGEMLALTWSAEVFWKQGINMYSELDNRLLKVATLYARGIDGVQYIPFGGPYGFFTQFAATGGGRSNNYAWNIIQNAYKQRLGIPTPYIDETKSLAGSDWLFFKSEDNSTAAPCPQIEYPSTTWSKNLTNIDIGDVGLPGTAKYQNGNWILKGAGSGFEVPYRTKADAFNFTFKEIEGNATIIAKIPSRPDGNISTSQYGVMVRDQLTADSKYAALFAYPNDGMSSVWRGADAWSKTNVSWNFPASRGSQSMTTSGVYPHWLKLARRGNRVELYHAADSIHWSAVSLVDIPLNEKIYIGLAVASTDLSTLNTFTFTNVGITQDAPSGSPVITSVLKAEAATGQAFNYVIAAINNPTSFSAVNLPQGLTLNTTTGTISGTPSAKGRYIVDVNATNSEGTGNAVLLLDVYTNSAPQAPQALSASPVDVYKVLLSWNASANSTSYTIKRSDTSGGTYTIVAAGITDTLFTDISAASGSNYYVVTASSGNLESSPSQEVLIVIPPKVPEKPVITEGVNYVDLTWSAVTGVDSYNVKRATSKDGPYDVIATGITEAHYINIGLTSGDLFYYVISANVNGAESPNSSYEIGAVGATNYVWSATPVSNLWSDPGNWQGGIAPSSPANLIFGTSTITKTSNDLTGLNVARIIFREDALADTLTGNAISITGGIYNTSVVQQVVALPMILNNVVELKPVNNKLILTGAVSGTGGLFEDLNQNGDVLLLNGANTFSGGTTLDGSQWLAFVGGGGAGAIGLPTSGPLGTGPVYLKDGGRLINYGYASLYNTIYIVDNNTVISSAGGFDFYGKLLGTGNFSHDGSNYAGFWLRGDLTGFEGTFVNLKRSSFCRFGFFNPNCGSARAKFFLDSNFNPACNQFNLSGTIDLGEFTGDGSLNGWNTAFIRIGALNTDATFTGTGTGPISFVKVGTGTQRFTGANTYYGTTVVEAGKFYANLSLNSPVIVNGGVFGGFGTNSSTITINQNGTLSPGDDGIGQLTTKAALSMSSGAIYAVEINSNTGTSDRVVANGVTLNNATLQVSELVNGTLPLGSNLTIIDNTSSADVVGTFNGLAEHTEINVSGYNFIITYQGGTGNDIVLLDSRSNQPYINSALTGNATEGTSYAYSITATGSPTYFTATNLPAGLNVDTSTGQISGTPTVSGIFNVALSAVTLYGEAVDTLKLIVTTNVAPLSPANLNVTNVYSFRNVISWTASPVSELTTGYTVKRSTTDGGPYTTIASNLTQANYTDNGLTYNTTYYYVVSAVNSFGESANSQQSSATTKFPSLASVPSNVSALAGNATVSIKWTASTEAASYSVMRATVSGGPYTTLSTGIATLNYTDNTAVNGTSYYYVVTASNIIGESAHSFEASASPDANVYSYWPLNENSGTTANDIWNARTLALNSATWDTGILESGVKLDGTSTNYLSLPSGIVSSLTNFTISLWIKPTAISTWARIFDFGTGTTNYMFLTTRAGTTPRYAIRTASVAEKVINSSVALTAGVWSHIAITQSGTTAIMYINGVEVGRNTAVTLTPSSLGNTTQNYFGKSQFTADPYINGNLDDIRIYKRALSASELAGMVDAMLVKAPTSIAASGFYKNVKVSWTASSKATGYNVMRATSSGGPYTMVATNVENLFYTDATAGLGQYYYVVTAMTSNFVSQPSPEASVTVSGYPALPEAPQDLVTIAGNAKANLRWTLSQVGAYYVVMRSSDGGANYIVVDTVSADTYVDNTVTNGSTYYYTVKAGNSTGVSANSIASSVTVGNVGKDYWPLDENAGNTTADMWSTYNGTLVGGSWKTGVSRSGVSLSGVSTEYITVPTGVVSGLTDFTISAWVKPNALSTWSRVFDFGTGTNNYMFLSVSNGSVPRFAIRTPSIAENSINGDKAIPLGSWTHFTITQKGTVATMYVNGIAVGKNESMALKPSSLGNTTLNYFGKSQWNDPYLNGTLDDIRIYDKALSTTEVAGLTNLFAPDAPSTVTATGTYKNVTVSWTASPEAVKYNVRRSTVSGGPYTIIASNITGTTFVDLKALSGNYYYVVSSVTDAYEGAPSSEAFISLPPLAPNYVIATGWNNRVDLSWAASLGASNYYVLRSTTSQGAYDTLVTTAATTYRDTTAVNDVRYYFVIVASGIGGSANSTEVDATPHVDEINTQWLHADVGSVGVSGNAGETNAIFSVYGSGTNLVDLADQFHFTYQPLMGDGAIVARIDNQDASTSYAKAGVTMRNALTTNAVNVTNVTLPEGMKKFIWRTATTANSAEIKFDNISNGFENSMSSHWVRLLRTNSNFDAFYSEDGVSWTKQGSQTLQMSDTIYVGLVNCATDNTVINTTTFDQVQVSTALPDITSDTTANGMNSIPFSYATVASNDPYHYGATGLPPGLSIDTSSGVISGTPVTAGTFTVSLIAVNAMGIDTVALTINIQPLNLKVYYRDGDNIASNDSIKPYLKIVNESGLNIAYNELTVRYWFTPENYAGINTWIDYAALGNSQITMNYSGLDSPRQGAFGFVEYHFNSSLGVLLNGANTGPIQSRLANKDWSSFDESNDYSHQAGSAYALNDHITLYRNGILIWGTEPVESTPQLNLKVYYQNVNTVSTSNTIHPYLKLANEGNVKVNYSDLKIRYWFTRDSNKTMKYWIDYAKLGSSNITGQFYDVSPAVSGADSYLELTMNAALGSLYPLSNTGEIKYRITKSDWSNFNEADDYSYLPAAPYAENNHVTVYYQGQLVYGTEPAGVNINARRSGGDETDQEETPDFQLYPNPVLDKVTISFGDLKTTNGLLKIYNSLGQLVRTESATGNAQTLNVKDLPSGVYFIKVENANSTFSRRFIKD